MVRLDVAASQQRPASCLGMIENYKGYELTGYGRQVQTQGRNIRHYANYLTERAKAYRDTKCDYVRGAEHRFEKLTIDKGLLREPEIVQQRIEKWLKSDVSDY